VRNTIWYPKRNARKAGYRAWFQVPLRLSFVPHSHVEMLKESVRQEVAKLGSERLSGRTPVASHTGALVAAAGRVSIKSSEASFDDARQGDETAETVCL
jgi:hypothetical protein